MQEENNEPKKKILKVRNSVHRPSLKNDNQIALMITHDDGHRRHTAQQPNSNGYNVRAPDHTRTPYQEWTVQYKSENISWDIQGQWNFPKQKVHMNLGGIW
jgi:hypothetical protein